jgi:amino acid transporter
MINCIVLGTFAGFVFLACLLFVAGDLKQVTESNAGPLLEILFNATKSRAGAICLLLFPLLCLFFAATSIMTTSSRMIWSFARDGGLPASKHLAIIHPTLEVPLNALILVFVAVLCFGCIFLGSSSAMSAIISA